MREKEADRKERNMREKELSYSSLPAKFYSWEKERTFPKPKVLLWNESLVKKLDWEDFWQDKGEIERANFLVGNERIENTRALSQAYAGHQFGFFNILGDGRAMLVAEKTNRKGEVLDLHLKGVGRTPYSRGGDGKATLSSMLREYLISEAMHALGIPTTRALAVTLTGEGVQRETWQKGAILARVAKSHLRVGSFQFASLGEESDLKALANYAIQRHYPEILSTSSEERKNPYVLLLRKVIERQASLIAKWQSIGFIHGVMNTDNMSISGESIDYGPCAFLDSYKPNTVFSSIDTFGRYAYNKQAKMGEWNLTRFAESLLPLLDAEEERAIDMASQELFRYQQIFQREYASLMTQKLGFQKAKEEYQSLVNELLELMERYQADYHNTFVRLSLEFGEEDARYLEGTALLYSKEDFQAWKTRWQDLLGKQGREKAEVLACMKRNNPFLIPRNFRVEEVLQEAGKGNYEPFHQFLKVLQEPYNYRAERRDYQELAKYSMEGYKTYCGT